jgi:hypothetical protein
MMTTQPITSPLTEMAATKLLAARKRLDQAAFACFREHAKVWGHGGPEDFDYPGYHMDESGDQYFEFKCDRQPGGHYRIPLWALYDLARWIAEEQQRKEARDRHNEERSQRLRADREREEREQYERLKLIYGPQGEQER